MAKCFRMAPHRTRLFKRVEGTGKRNEKAGSCLEWHQTAQQISSSKSTSQQFYLSSKNRSTVSFPFLSHSTAPISVFWGDKAYNTAILLRSKPPWHQGVFLAEYTASFSPIIIWRAATQPVPEPVRKRVPLLLCWRLSRTFRLKSNMKISIINPFIHRPLLGLEDCNMSQEF